MNGRTATRIHKQALSKYREWMISMLPEDEVSKIRKPDNNHPVYGAMDRDWETVHKLLLL